ncbi:unnamed protein product [Periconia digitata]|uniref:HAT C-terminal dimerisation domain-containing protein n=1 Tax=Periconia digitata TaxID=1303443 RepID=A0A9W4U910_9PLEO|nr:unnamed protein product [Periconia digitata]
MDNNHRIRCAGHILNLLAKALIYGDGVSKFEEDLARASPQEQYKLYRRHGVVGKLHNFVNSICNSHKRRRTFHSIQREVLDEAGFIEFATLNLVKDGGIRWHSVYLMLLRCEELQETIRKYFKALRTDAATIDDDYDAATDALSGDDWDEVSAIIKVLQLFYENCKSLEGNTSQSGFGSLWQTIVNLQEIYEVLTEDVNLIEGVKHSTYLTQGINLAREKLITYFEKLVIYPSLSLYCVATALHPRLRLLWFKTHWKHHKIWHRKAESSIHAVFKKYLDAEDNNTIEIDDDEPSVRKIPGAYADDARRQRTMAVDVSLFTGRKSYKRHKRVSQLDEYLDSIDEDFRAASLSLELSKLLDDPYKWWIIEGQHRYPVVYKMAMDHLSIPSTSCDCERAFSTAKRTITCDRNSLSPAVIEATQLQKNWIRRRIVPSSIVKLIDYIQTRDGAQNTIQTDNRAQNTRISHNTPDYDAFTTSIS